MTPHAAWDDIPSIDIDPDELAPTCKVIPFPAMTFAERILFDHYSLDLRVRYGTEAA